jgi:hypothetical protein
MISTTDGAFPRWSGDGKRLFYIGLNGAMMTVDLQTGASIQQTGAPRQLFGNVPVAPYAVNRAGDRFLFVDVPSSSGPPPPFTVVLNWMSRLKQ